MKRHQQWKKWLSDSSNMKKASPPPLSQQWRNSPGRSRQSKRICPAPHLYGPISQLLGVIASLLRREHIEATHRGAPCGFTCLTTERTSGSGMENLPQHQRHECMSCEVKEAQKWILLGKTPLQFPTSSSPDSVESLILLLILWKRLVRHFYSR